MRDFNRITIATLNGVIAANVANNSADMVFSCGVGVSGSDPTAAISAESIIDASQTLGDRKDQVSVLMIHSVVETKLKKLNLIDFIPDSQGVVNIPTYLGYRVMVSDTLPVTSLGGGNFRYTSYLSAPGILGFAESPPDMPVETDRDASAGMGSGMEKLYTRRQFALHPLGHNWKETTVSAQFPSDTELATAGNWERKFPERKQVPFVAIYSLNG